MASPWEQAKAGQKISAPKQSKYQGYQGQSGGSSSIPSQGKRDAFVNLQRQKFFGDRDVPEERVLRRTRQEGALNQFKDALVRNNRVVTGTRPDGTEYVVRNANTGEPIYLTDIPGGRSVSDVAQNLAYRFGPTPGEIFGDIGYGLGNIARGFGDFIGRGGVIGSVLSDLYGRVKGGAQQGIETVGDLYDNLRSAFSGQPTVTYGGGSTMVTTSDGQPRVDLTPTSITTETLPSMDLSRNVGDESDPSIFGITNTGVPLPFLRSTADLPYNNISSFNPDTYQPGYLPEGYSNLGVSPIVPEYSTPVPQGIQDLTPGLSNAEYFLRSELRDNTPPNQRFEANYTLPGDHPVNLANRIMFYPKNGGSVDKYAGLGYKLK